MTSKEIRLVLNAIGLYSNVYALKNINSPALQNPFALGFGGQYQVIINSYTFIKTRTQTTRHSI